MVKIRDIKETECTLYSPSGKVGLITSTLQLYDVRIQIIEQQLNGYYVIWKKHIILINKHGALSEHPKGFYEHFDNMLDKLLGLK